VHVHVTGHFESNLGSATISGLTVGCARFYLKRRVTSKRYFSLSYISPQTFTLSISFSHSPQMLLTSLNLLAIIVSSLLYLVATSLPFQDF
jgi:hypothetical protein